MEYLKRLITVTVGLSILIGIPYFADEQALVVLSWIPAVCSVLYLED